MLALSSLYKHLSARSQWNQVIKQAVRTILLSFIFCYLGLQCNSTGYGGTSLCWSFWSTSCSCCVWEYSIPNCSDACTPNTCHGHWIDNMWCHQPVVYVCSIQCMTLKPCTFAFNSTVCMSCHWTAVNCARPGWHCCAIPIYRCRKILKY